MTIYKYSLPLNDYSEIEMPQGAEILAVQWQGGGSGTDGGPKIWALVCPSNQVEKRCFRMAGTGHEINDTVIRYAGTFQMAQGALVFHVFEVRPR